MSRARFFLQALSPLVLLLWYTVPGYRYGCTGTRVPGHDLVAFFSLDMVRGIFQFRQDLIPCAKPAAAASGPCAARATAMSAPQRAAVAALELPA